MAINSRKVGGNRNRVSRSQAIKSLWVIFCVALLQYSGNILAQSAALIPEVGPLSGQIAETTVTLDVSLPGSLRMATSMSKPDQRQRVLLDLAAARGVLDYARQNKTADSPALAQQYLLDRGWLERLVEKYGWSNPHSAILDPAAWLVMGALQKHELPPMALVHPDHTPETVLTYQVFQRSNERLAAANLPILLNKLEAEVIPVWDAFLQLVDAGGEADPAWKEVEDEWFAYQRNPLFLAQDAAVDSQEWTVTYYAQTLSRMVLSAVDARPPDPARLRDLRFSLFKGIAGLELTEKREARSVLHLATLVDGLQDRNYFEFIQGLLLVTSDLLEQASNTQQVPLLADWLLLELPAISAHYAADFALVDPRLNATLSTVYNVLLAIAQSNITIAIRGPQSALADAVAQLSLLIPDMGYYFDTPVRSRIVGELDVCSSIAATRDEQGYPAMTRRQFDVCIEKLLQLADQETRMAELSGSVNGPFRTDSLRRELSVTPDQRINYHIGYLHDHYATGCPLPDNALPNPLEWAVLATIMSWFAEYAPEYFMTPENESRLTKMRSIGEQLMLDMAEQTACFAGENINDPVSRMMADYESALRQLNAGIVAADADFRAQNLRSGADILLDQGAGQRTGYRPDELVIKPCDERNVCEMSGDLSATRALIGLFPEEYLVAEQSGLVEIEVCYRNMEWVERRSELVRPDDENVANYYGRLGFDLVGRFVEEDESQDLFAFRFKSPAEYHYLFAQASDEVLQDSCPVEWIGSRVITPLRVDRGGIVPNRLTYLAASRTLPSRLLQSNWERGAEWRDWFITGIGVSALTVPPVADINTPLDQHLQSLYQAKQAEIYRRVLVPNAQDLNGEDVSIYDEMSQVSMTKALLRMQMMLFYPESLLTVDEIRMAVAGDAGLLERRTLSRFKEDNVPFTSVIEIARKRLHALRNTWSEQPEAIRREGTIPPSLMHAMTRVNILYRQFFTSVPEPLEEVPLPSREGLSQQSTAPAAVED